MPSLKRITKTQMRLVKPGIRLFTALHVYLYKATRGRLFHRMGGGEICIVKMTGAKSGQSREFPLMYVPYKNGIVLVASLAGAPNHPVWYHNLVRHPEFEVTVGSQTKRLAARIASRAEKAAVWPLCCQAYPAFQLYQDRTERDIPVFICEPRDAQ
jgi:F420H(2)-dependent quinone reductase